MFPNFANVFSERRDIMKTIEEVIGEIEELRQLMYFLVNEKYSLTDPKLVALSQTIDKLLNDYDELINKGI